MLVELVPHFPPARWLMGDKSLLFSEDAGRSDSVLTITVSRVQEKGQERALWSGDLQILQRSSSGQSDARWPVCSQL